MLQGAAGMGTVSLTAIDVKLSDPVFNAMRMWPFKDEFVSRLLIDDIPQRVKYGSCKIWAYRDPQSTLVGFGTLDICTDCSEFTDSQPHTYIPLLAVHPEMQGRGHGKSIVHHLVEEAACIVASSPDRLHHAIFLDVYEESIPAIRLYAGCNFVTLNGPLVDDVNGKTFFVMAKRVTR
jgi:ribosomal protein S18 acetylase RimI-like enzyme